MKFWFLNHHSRMLLSGIRRKIIYSTKSSKLLKFRRFCMIILFAGIFFISFAPVYLSAQSPAQTVHIGDFTLENGQTIKDCKVAYRTFGTPNADSSNVILNLTWFGGTTAHLGRFCVPGKIVDSTKYFIIAVAALGNGESSSPSNSEMQPGNDFPQFNIRDMVHAAYKMLQKQFGLTHIKAVLGGSMGSMQALEWTVQYPDFMDKAVAYVATPKLTFSDLLLMRIQEQIIQTAGADTSTAWANLSALTRYMVRTPDYVTRHTWPGALDSLWQIWQQAKHTPFTLQNYRAQLKAMQQHDIFKAFGGSMQETAKRIIVPVLLIVSESDHLLNPLPAQDFAKYLNAELLLLKGNCGHLEPGCQMGKVSQAIQKFLADEIRQE